RDGAYLARVIAAEGVTTLHFVPSMLQVFLDEPGLEAQCAGLRRVVCSGEALPADLQERFFARTGGGVQLHNLYGPTEAAVDVTYWSCVAGDGRRGVPIGAPIHNTRIHLLDAGGREVPVGVAGELYIAGAIVGRGYLDRPGLTAERFVPDAFSAQPGARLYRTGDLARWLPEGVVEYLGRVDFQVKLRGFRIELGEIEAALCAHPAVREAVVTVRDDAPGGPRLVAYAVPADGAAPDPAEARAFLKERLPEHMVPAAFVFVSAFPLSPSGKVERRALPAPEAPRADAAFVAPGNPLETAIAAAWAEVLGVERVGIDDNFFDLGGHSLLLVRVHTRLRPSLPREVSVVDLFRHATVRALAAFVAQGGPDAPAGRQQVDERARRQKSALDRQRQLAAQRKARHV
ncbi:MAG: AMP-binding protein, partial [Gemmatimonadetes bacterium]|nr:AMP-binding protein [Gemmatimonadota bacterium]